jgi:cell wall assembly regulator SMI1
MDPPRPLDADTLDRLVRRLGDLGVAHIEDRRPGLSSDEIRSLTRQLPVALPSEAQLWFSRWTWGEDLYDMLPHLRYHPLPNCVFLYEHALEMADGRRERAMRARGGALPVGYEPPWIPVWFPLSWQEGPLYIAADLSASDGVIAPIHWIDNGGGELCRPLARSLGEFVSRSLDEIDAGEWLYDRENHNWQPKGGWVAKAEHD